MKFLILGCGSIGERHISNLVNLVPSKTIYCYDPIAEQLKRIKKYHVNILSELPASFSDFSCVFICTPPNTHVKLATLVLKSKSNVFIEKPLSIDFKGIKTLQTLVKQNKLLAFVGYNLRFHSGLVKVKKLIEKETLGHVIHAHAYYGQYLPDWRPNQNYKKNYSFLKKLGGNIIFDSSHEINYVSWIFGKPTSVVSSAIESNFLKTNVIALTDSTFSYSKNQMVSIHLDMIRRKYKRSLEILCEYGIIKWNLKNKKITIFDIRKSKPSVIHINEDVNQMYVKEIKHVIECIKKHKKSNLISLETGIETFTLCNAIEKANKKYYKIKL
jgi:predicted dehydrogenase